MASGASDGTSWGLAPLLPPEPLCVLCVGDKETLGVPCARCHATGIDPDRLAPVVAGFAVAGGSG